ncbi:FadR/GntR family transcriptional regulator [Selenomonas ruminantium]|uniref:Transcriptional regulator, GntR family n=1 Tax=Selenomonas ruminantium TaxID=971 RepID=A0A1H0VDM8_SELRU|nr:FadR/GntR family transcriptional regulator [Selenomonas ruminantium]SDP76454.1 transcriptional regulator, GntR family [Selenomonas ruminantium]
MSKSTLAEDTAQAIINYIIKNELQPGDKLPTEPVFMEKLGVGRGTLREGIKLLAARNILDIRQGAGSFVSHQRGIPDDPLGLTFIEDDADLIVDMLDVRLLFEPHVARLAATKASEEEKAEILAQAEEVERCIAEGESYVTADARFHRLIAEASGNRVFGNLTYILNTSIAKNIEITKDVQRDSNTIRYHRKIAEAIKGGHPNDAASYMNMHLQLLREFAREKRQ